MPAASQTGADRRAGDHAGARAAGTSLTWAAPKRPCTAWGIEVPFRAMATILRVPSLTAFSTAGGTSLALP